MLSLLFFSLKIAASLLIFGLLIFVHELGHFLTARLFSIGVNKFSIGFGKALFQKKHGKTTYQVAVIPLGGFVEIVGQTPDSPLPKGFEETESFHLRPAWQRFLVIFAGAFFNFVLAFIVFWAIFSTSGQQIIPPVVGEVKPDSPAQSVGIHPKDRILAINDTPIHKWEDILIQFQLNNGAPATISIERADTAPFILNITPVKLTQQLPEKKATDFWGIGITPAAVEHRNLTIMQAMLESLNKVAEISSWTLKSFKALIFRDVSVSQLSGPLGIAQEFYEQASYGVRSLFAFAAVISINLGILNLLPIPVLDGGHLLFISIEIIFRRSVSEKIQYNAMMVGIVLLLSLVVMATFLDISRLF